MLSLLLGLVVLCLVVYLLWWLLNQLPLPHPVRVVATVIFVLIVVFALLNYLPLPSLGHGRFLH